LKTDLIILKAFSLIAIWNGFISLVPLAHFGFLLSSFFDSRMSVRTDSSSELRIISSFY
jgi:hypothetical protein